MKCDMWHQGCGCRKMFGGFLWLLGFVSLVFAWIAARNGGLMGYDALFWMMNALVLGVLAIPLKRRKKECGMGMMGCGSGRMEGCCDKETGTCNGQCGEEK